jgi:hypothetical protein
MDKYLILLGGPFAAAVLAKGIVSAKTTSGTLQVPANQAASIDAVSAPVTPAAGSAKPPEVSDIVANNPGELDLVDTQYLVFNLVLFVYAAGTFISNTGNANFRLPDLPATLLGLTSLSALTYVGNKAAQRSAPGISGVTHASDAAGIDIVITGTNLRPPGTSMSDDEVRAGNESHSQVQARIGTPLVGLLSVVATPVSVLVRPDQRSSGGSFTLRSARDLSDPIATV